jgi:hypothetical protein
MVAAPVAFPTYANPIEAEFDRLSRLVEAAGGPVDFPTLRGQVKAWLRGNLHILATGRHLDYVVKKAEDAYIESRSSTGLVAGRGATGQLPFDFPIAPDDLIALSDRKRLYQKSSIASYDQLRAHKDVRIDAVKRMLDVHNRAIAQIDDGLNNWKPQHRHWRDVWRDLYGYTGP